MTQRSNSFDPGKINLSACVPACLESDLHPELLEYIRRAQHLAGFAFDITSGFRPKSWEFSRGRNGSSSHTKGLAVDISTPNSHIRYKVLLSLAFVGVPRLGVGKSFIHADIDETKAHPIIFDYYDSKNAK